MSEATKHRWQIHGSDPANLDAIFEILDKLGLNLAINKFEEEKLILMW